MTSKGSIKSIALTGVDGYLVEVECDISNSIPGFQIVGLPDMSVKESRERVVSALKCCGFDYSIKKIVVNLAPAATKKSGASLDLPIFLSVLHRIGRLNSNALEYAFVGELSLTGEIRPVSGAVAMALVAKEYGLKGVFVPSDNALEASVVEGINVYKIDNVFEIFKLFAIEDIDDAKELTPVKTNFHDFYKLAAFDVDMDEVVGAEIAKRACEIAAAGGHNLLLIGAPGSGKSMLAKRLPTILPPLIFEEAIETTKIHSVAGLLTKENPVVVNRPFRSPHHTISAAGLTGGGANPRPGEISLAHNGVLFLDEFSEYQTNVLDSLRAPMEDGVVTVSRVAGSWKYPCEFILVAAMNPCKCGYYGHPKVKCSCSDIERHRYIKRISGPILDRIDLQIEVPICDYDSLSRGKSGDSSKVIAERVARAREIQFKRLSKSGIYCNANMSEALVHEFCILTDSANTLLKNAYEKMSLSARTRSRILKVSRTIADLEACDMITEEHIAQAIQFRCLDKKYW